MKKISFQNLDYLGNFVFIAVVLLQINSRLKSENKRLNKELNDEEKRFKDELEENEKFLDISNLINEKQKEIISNLTEELNQIKDKNEKLNESIIDLKSKLDEVNLIKIELNEKNDNLNKTISRLEDENSRSNKEIMNKLNISLDENVKLVKIDIVSKESIKQLNERIEKLKNSKTLLNEEINDLNLKLDAEKNTNSSLDNELKLLKNKLDQQINVTNNLEMINQEKSREIEDLKHSNELLNESVNDLFLELGIEKNANTCLTNVLQNKLNQLEFTIEKLKNDEIFISNELNVIRDTNNAKLIVTKNKFKSLVDKMTESFDYHVVNFNLCLDQIINE